MSKSNNTYRRNYMLDRSGGDYVEHAEHIPDSHKKRTEKHVKRALKLRDIDTLMDMDDDYEQTRRCINMAEDGLHWKAMAIDTMKLYIGNV